MIDAQRTASAVRGLAELLARHPALMDLDWCGLGMVVRADRQGDGLNQMYGSVYLRDGTSVSLPFDLGEIAPYFEQLLESSIEDQPERGPWYHCMFQIERPSGRTKLQFEYNDPDRWAFRGSEISAIIDRLRPNFASDDS